MQTAKKVEIRGNVPIQFVTPFENYALIMTCEENLRNQSDAKGLIIVSTDTELLPGEPVIRRQILNQLNPERVKYPFIGMPQTYHPGENGIKISLAPVSENVVDLEKKPTYVYLAELKKFFENPFTDEHHEHRPYTVARLIGVNWLEHMRSDFHIFLEDEIEASKLEKICRTQKVLQVEPKSRIIYGGL